MTDLERAILHIKTRADAWAVKEVEKALIQEPKCQYCKHTYEAKLKQYEYYDKVLDPYDMKYIRCGKGGMI